MRGDFRRFVSITLGLAVLVAAIGLFALFTLKSGDNSIPASSGRSPARPSDDAREPPPLPEPESVASERTADPALDTGAEPPPPTRPSAGFTIVPGPYLRGRLDGLVANAPWTKSIGLLPHCESPPSRDVVSRIVVRRRRLRRDLRESDDEPSDPGPPPASMLHVALGAGGVFEEDLGPLLAVSDAASGSQGAALVSIEVFADDPSYMPERRDVAIPFDARTTHRDVAVTIPVRAAARVRGRLEAAERDRRAERPELHGVVALLAPLPTQEAPFDVASASDHFELRAPRDGPATVVIACDGFAPAQVPVDLTLGGELDLGVTTLEALALISGSVVWPAAGRGGFPIPDERAEVCARLVDTNGTMVDLPGAPLLFANGHLIRRSRAVTTGPHPKGRAPFEIDGLAPGLGYRVALGRSDDRSSSTVVAPAIGVELKFDRTYVAVDVMTASGPLAGATVRITSLAEGATTDEQGRAGFLVAPGSEGELEVGAPGFLPARAPITAGPAGTVARATARLEPVPVHATLALDLQCDGLAEVKWIVLRFEPIEAQFRSSFPREVACERSQAHLDDLPEGRFKVAFALVTGPPANPSAATQDGRVCVTSAMLLDPKLEVELARERPCKQSVALLRGGTVRLTAHDRPGRALTPDCIVRDAKGETVDFYFVHDERSVVWGPGAGGWSAQQVGVASYGARTLRGDSACSILPALAPGHYSIELAQEGYETTTLPIELTAGQTLDLDALLPRTR